MKKRRYRQKVHEQNIAKNEQLMNKTLKDL